MTAPDVVTPGAEDGAGEGGERVAAPMSPLESARAIALARQLAAGPAADSAVLAEYPGDVLLALDRLPTWATAIIDAIAT